jgi:magnesium-transporting ATPase (P-type)
MKKNVIKRIVSITLVLSGLFTATTGIWNFFPPFNESFSPGHAVGGCVFCSICIIHIWLNWKPLLRYFKGLGWWWCLIVLGLIAIISVITVPILR